MFSYPKQYRGGVNPVGAVQPHIYRDPPKSITTRKKERVNIADVMYMVQSDTVNGDPTRINEGIQLYARGQNPMVDISYSNMGGGSTNTSLSNNQAHPAYKVEVVRPPLMPIETLQPISAPRMHQNYTMSSNPSMAPVSIAGNIDQNQVQDAIREDIAEGHINVNPSLMALETFNILPRNKHLDRIVLEGSIRPTASYDLDFTRELNTLRGNAVNESVNTYSVSANFSLNNNEFDPRDLSNPDNRGKMMRDFQLIPVNSTITFNNLINGDGTVRTGEITKAALKDMQKIGVSSNPTFSNIVVYDPKSNTSLDVASNVKEKNYIGVQAAMGMPLMLNTNDGKQIVLKDYSYSVVQSNIGNPQMVIQVNQPDVALERNTPIFAATTNIMYTNTNTNTGRTTQENIHLDKLNNFGGFEDRVSYSAQQRTAMPTSGLGKKERIVAM